MITPIFLAIPSNTLYSDLTKPLTFPNDIYGFSNWLMKPSLHIYSLDLRTKHTFRSQGVTVSKVSSPSLQQRWKYFVITRNDGRRYYCTGQVYYQPTTLKCKQSLLFYSKQIYKQFYLPKCIVLLSQQPYYKLHVNLLKVYRQLKKAAPNISHNVNQTMLRVYDFLHKNGRQNEWQSISLQQPQNCTILTPSLQIVFDYYLSVCNNHLQGQSIYTQKRTNRQVLHVYKLNHDSLYQACYIFHLPFSPNTLRTIISAILQQKQIIFTSNNSNLTTLIIQTIMKMILPLKWCYMYVPNLPAHMMQPAEQSFMPYIVGIHKKNLHLIDKTNRVIVYVEQDRVAYDHQLFLFDSSLSKHLTYVNNENTNYFEWQKQIRIKSILLICSILKECINPRSDRTYKKPKQKQFLANMRVSFAQNRLSYPKLFTPLTSPQQLQHSRFLNEFMNNSMMFKHFKEDSYRGITQQINILMNMPKNQQMGYLVGKFNVISTQFQFPLRINNERQWIRYYHSTTQNQNQKYYSSNRKALVFRNKSSGGIRSAINILSIQKPVDSKLRQVHTTTKSLIFPSH